jgi:S-methylmethionine-dependent homocysteine/selenocysteine methylase
MTITILDGGMGQELLARSTAQATGLWSAQILLDDPDLVRTVHADYLAAGADVITTNSYILHRDRLAPFGVEDRFEELHSLACRLAVEARDAHGAGLVAGSLGPNARSYRPDLALPEDQAVEAFAEIARLQARMWTCCYARPCRPSSRLAVLSWALEQWACRFGWR